MNDKHTAFLIDRLRDNIKEECLAKTVAARIKYLGEDPVNVLTAKSRAVIDLMKKNLGNIGDAFVHHQCELLEIQDPETYKGLFKAIKEVKKTNNVAVQFEPFTIIVHTGNYNGHNYTIGEPAMVVHGKRRSCIKKDGTLGNDYDSYLSHVRPATPEEVKDFLDNLKMNHISSMMASEITAPFVGTIMDELQDAFSRVKEMEEEEEKESEEKPTELVGDSQ